MQPLDNAAWWALTGPHQGLATGWGGARRYPAEMAPFAAVPDHPGPAAWHDLAELGSLPPLAGRGGTGQDRITCDEVASRGIVLFRKPLPLPAGWAEDAGGDGVQLVWDRPAPDVDDAATGPAVEPLVVERDGPAALELVQRTRPGPFSSRTLALGGYLGVRDPDTGALVAMAGQRLHLDGACEISAVCTDPAWRGRGLATRLVRALVAGITGRGEVPFLHAASDNTRAIRLYLAMGFAHRCHVRFARLRPPEAG